MERGFFHPDHGYWQTTGNLTEEILATYPPNTVEVALKPGLDYQYLNGGWVYVAPAEPAPSPDDIRAMRDGLLAATDWVVTKAVEQNAVDGLGIQVPLVWADYRQALRDVPQQAGFPDNVIWPTAPE